MHSYKIVSPEGCYLGAPPVRAVCWHGIYLRFPGDLRPGDQRLLAAKLHAGSREYRERPEEHYDVTASKKTDVQKEMLHAKMITPSQSLTSSSYVPYTAEHRLPLRVRWFGP